MKSETVELIKTTFSNGNVVYFEKSGEMLFDQNWDFQAKDLLDNLVTSTCPEESSLAKALYGWACELIESDKVEDWSDCHSKMTQDRADDRPIADRQPRKVQNDFCEEV